jgi:hypothetical protein
VDFVKYCQIKFTNQRTVQVISANQSEVTIYGNVSREVAVVVFVGDCLPFGDLGCALRHRPAPVAPWLPHEWLASG